ncbi:MAG: hypothetical protein K2P70_14305 [Hyphomonadaceae bacterium]|jgi:hypothetical protein|nr:hypothetical protein [Hyphomonadaceae bacterium]
MSDIAVENAQETNASPPSKRWRNTYWLAKRLKFVTPDGTIEDGPGRHVSRRVWPSREIAEAKGLWSVENALNREYITYLGPVED